MDARPAYPIFVHPPPLISCSQYKIVPVLPLRLTVAIPSVQTESAEGVAIPAMVAGSTNIVATEEIITLQTPLCTIALNSQVPAVDNEAVLRDVFPALPILVHPPLLTFCSQYSTVPVFPVRTTVVLPLMQRFAISGLAEPATVAESTKILTGADTTDTQTPLCTTAL